MNNKCHDSDLEDEPYFESDHEDDAACIYCNLLYSLSRAGEDWICCQNCREWCHSMCADVSRGIKSFICELCTD